MAEKPADTSSPEVVPTLTKTDARELKSLVSRDSKILLEELQYRYGIYMDSLQAQYRAEQKAIGEERAAREQADEAALAREMSKVQRRVDTLNVAIGETLVALEDAGWRSPGNVGGITGRTRWMIGLPSDRLLPPSRDDEDLKNRTLAADKSHQQAMEDLNENYQEARRMVVGREADMLRSLTLQSITTEAAREFILEFPTSNDLLPAPTGLEALPPPVGLPDEVE